MEVKRFAFITPMWLDIENPYPPLGVAYIASRMLAAGIEVRIFDFSLEKDKSIDEKVSEVVVFAPDAIGISCMTNTYANALEIAKRLKKGIDAPIIFGGPHVTVFPEETLKNPEVDYVISGEGEYSSLELLGSIGQGNAIEGAGHKEDGKINFAPSCNYITDLDALPFPARQLLDLDSYELTGPDGGPMATIMTSRGCPFGCTYCFKQLFGMKYRTRSPENIYDEIVQLTKDFGYRNFYFIDDLFTFDPERVKSLCDMIKDNGLDIKWQCLARVDKVDHELLRIMKDAGCYKIHFGIESASQEILATIQKAINLDQVRKAVADCKELGIQTKGYFMLALPGDTEATMRKTIGFAYELDLDESMFSVTTPFPGTKMWNQVPDDKKEELKKLFDKAYYYANQESVPILYNMSEVSDEKLNEMMEEVDKMHYRLKIERKHGKPKGTIIYSLATTFPTSIILKNYFQTRNKMRQEVM
ncbi:B12-binding domain-containing radical SAM protein [Candidatus Altiarchaeota archaeon]